MAHRKHDHRHPHSLDLDRGFAGLGVSARIRFKEQLEAERTNEAMKVPLGMAGFWVQPAPADQDDGDVYGEG